MESNSRVYVGLPLDEQRVCVRLLTLLPGAGDDHIHCKLKVVTLSTFRNYEALSYTWGSSVHDFPITVNSQQFHITKHLAKALKCLKRTDKRRTLWVDAICIDQNDLKARAAQVREMGNIFRCAEQVLIWLGEGNEHTDRTLMEAQRVGSTRAIDMSQGLQDILHRTWWTRVWVSTMKPSRIRTCLLFIHLPRGSTSSR